jgi:hypothetical protein
MEKLVVFMFAICWRATFSQTQASYISNGNFEFPIIPRNNYFVEMGTNWTMHYVDLCKYSMFNGFMNQFVDLQAGLNQNGYIQQEVILKNSSNCTLFYQQKAPTNIYKNHVIEIYWNEIL